MGAIVRAPPRDVFLPRRARRRGRGPASAGAISCVPMRCARPFLVALVLPPLAWLPLACSSGNTTSSTGPNLGGTSTGAASSDDEPVGSTTVVAEGSGDGTSSSTGGASLDDTGTSTSDDPASTTGDGCPLGSEGCPCSAGTCDGDLQCLEGTCQTVCEEDVFEPNDEEATPTDLGEINDNDGNGGIVSASLHHAGDVDWYRYAGNDDITGNVDPARELVASGGVRLCKFLECDNGLAETEFECPAGTQYALSTMARSGCCASDGFALPDLNCNGVTEDNAAVYIRVDQPEPACVTYSVSYHY